MKKISVNELRSAAGEASAALAAARLAKFFETTPGVFRLKFNSPSKGEVNVLADVSFGAFLASRVPESPSAPTQFAAAVRSRLDNAALRGVALVNDDRVVRFDFEKRERFALVFEFVGKGNALLLDDAGKIIFVWKPAVFAARKLVLREAYVAPPAGGKTPSGEGVPRSSAEIEAEYWMAERKPPEKKESGELRALEKSLEAQCAALPAFEDEERGALAAGNWIKTHRAECEEVVAAAKTGNDAALKKFKARKSGAFVEFEA